MEMSRDEIQDLIKSKQIVFVAGNTSQFNDIASYCILYIKTHGSVQPRSQHATP